MRKGYLYILFFLPFFAFSQQKSKLDSLNTGKSVEDSVMYAHLKKRLTKSKIGKQLYNAIFRDVYNANHAKRQLSSLEANPYEQYAGKTIKSIQVISLDIFGPSVNDTTKKGNKIEHFASKTFHSNTRESVIRESLLLFKEGDILDPQVLKDNERLLRKNTIIHDARIYIKPRDDAEWMVDVLVLIQDVWSLNFTASGNSLKNFSVGVEEKNFQGRGNSLLNKVTWRENDPYQRFGLRSIYTVPYIKNTFVSGQARIINERDLAQYAFQVSRPFLTINTKNAGAFEMGYSRVRENKKLPFNNRDSLFVYNTKYFYSDMWYGRSFSIDKNSPNKQLVLAIRRSYIHYLKRPEVSADTNLLYWNRSAWLASIGFSSRNYHRDFLIYGFGRTEDVPIGVLLSVTGGYDNTEFGKRAYASMQFAKGQYLRNNNGYLYNLIGIGSYINKTELQQGVLGLQSFYFSNLNRVGRIHARHFLNLGITYGINRDHLDYLNISGKEGITGVNSDALRGDKRLTLGYELVVFSPKSILGFRVAYFAFTNLGMVSLKGVPLFTSKLYQGFGLGIRLRNENLAINTFQIRIGLYPNIPDLSSPFRYAFDTSQPLKLRDFDITAPSILPLK